MAVMGIGWVLGLGAGPHPSVAIQYSFALLNAFQGVFIFYFHCYSDASVRRAYRIWLEKGTRRRYGESKSYVSSRWKLVQQMQQKLTAVNEMRLLTQLSSASHMDSMTKTASLSKLQMFPLHSTDNEYDTDTDGSLCAWISVRQQRCKKHAQSKLKFCKLHICQHEGCVEGKSSAYVHCRAHAHTIENNERKVMSQRHGGSHTNNEHMSGISQLPLWRSGSLHRRRESQWTTMGISDTLESAMLVVPLLVEDLDSHVDVVEGRLTFENPLFVEEEAYGFGAAQRNESGMSDNN